MTRFIICFLATSASAFRVENSENTFGLPENEDLGRTHAKMAVWYAVQNYNSNLTTPIMSVLKTGLSNIFTDNGKWDSDIMLKQMNKRLRRIINEDKNWYSSTYVVDHLAYAIGGGVLNTTTATAVNVTRPTACWCSNFMLGNFGSENWAGTSTADELSGTDVDKAGIYFAGYLLGSNVSSMAFAKSIIKSFFALRHMNEAFNAWKKPNENLANAAAVLDGSANYCQGVDATPSQGQAAEISAFSEAWKTKQGQIEAIPDQLDAAAQSAETDLDTEADFVFNNWPAPSI
jgi:hypothetical protein|eukprot:TRINITY_DN3422_c0_g1_i1.p1 TRINITY_DN3422_c0_g1~~TRINITY_DN3422_c0_g1_i1.p1  ORF type:complete len:289 (-),score=23.52 TRINITY_DN3422_c0_g1_i1:32-898(-)